MIHRLNWFKTVPLVAGLFALLLLVPANHTVAAQGLPPPPQSSMRGW